MLDRVTLINNFLLSEFAKNVFLLPGPGDEEI
jgi:hypothetical protein